MQSVITSQEFKAAVSRAGGRKATAQKLEVSPQTISRWSSHGVVDGAEHWVRDRMAEYLRIESAPPLAMYSDRALLRELEDRLDQLRNQDEMQTGQLTVPNTPTVSGPDNGVRGGTSGGRRSPRKRIS